MKTPEELRADTPSRTVESPPAKIPRAAPSRPRTVCRGFPANRTAPANPGLNCPSHHLSCKMCRRALETGLRVSTTSSCDQHPPRAPLAEFLFYVGRLLGSSVPARWEPIPRAAAGRGCGAASPASTAARQGSGPRSSFPAFPRAARHASSPLSSSRNGLRLRRSPRKQ